MGAIFIPFFKGEGTIIMKKEIRNANCNDCLSSSYGACMRYGGDGTCAEDQMCMCCTHPNAKHIVAKISGEFKHFSLIMNTVEWDDIAEYLGISVEDVISEYWGTPFTTEWGEKSWRDEYR